MEGLAAIRDSDSHPSTHRPGPFFVAFPNLAQALKNNTPIRTNARSSTILPNFVG